MFIAVDGIDGAGKTTLVRRLAHTFADLDTLATKEPTNTSEWGKALRNSATRGRMPGDQEVEYFHKDRIHHLNSEIGPALTAGRLVICDRYVDSTLAFQGKSPAEAARLYASFVKEIVVPDVTLILDCPVEIGISRIRKARSRLSEFEDIATLERARKIYRSRQGPHYVHIDASKSIHDTFHQVCTELKARFPQLSPYLVECNSSADSDRNIRTAIA